MVELGYLSNVGTRVSRIWRNYDIYDMVELGYLGNGGTRIFAIWWNWDI